MYFDKFIISSLMLLAVSSSAFATSTQVNFSGFVTSKDSTTSGTLNSIKVGDRIEGSFIYDAATAVDSNTWAVVGGYAFTSANSSFSINIYDTQNGGALLYSDQGYLNSINTENNWTYAGYPTIDAFSPYAKLSKGWEAYLYLQNRDVNLDYITSDVLPEGATINSNNYNYTKGTILNASSIGQVYFNLTNVAAVPEPASIPLLATGLALIALIARRRKVMQQP